MRERQEKAAAAAAGAASDTGTMREIVHIQAGQCGNQIGAKVRAGAGRRWGAIPGAAPRGDTPRVARSSVPK